MTLHSNIGQGIGRETFAHNMPEKNRKISPQSPRTIPLIEARERIERRACRRFSRSHLFTKAPSRDIAVMSYIVA